MEAVLMYPQEIMEELWDEVKAAAFLIFLSGAIFFSLGLVVGYATGQKDAVRAAAEPAP
jgi:hypothetical protein